MTPDTKSYQILGRVIAQSTARLNVMDLEIFAYAAVLAMPSISFQDCMTELAISLGRKLQAWPFGPNASQEAT